MGENISLLSCPFCGSEARVQFMGVKRIVHVGCSNNDCAIQPSLISPTEDEAAVVWNKRTPSASQQ